MRPDLRTAALPNERPWHCEPGRVIVRVRLTPRSASATIAGTGMTVDGPAVMAKVDAAPMDGAANKALTTLLAAWIDVPRSVVAVTGGAKSRIKTVEIRGNTEEIALRIADQLSRLSVKTDARAREAD